MGYATKKSKRKEIEALKKESGEKVSTEFAQFQLAEYEQFDDYLEMVIEFGYITMFASSFPLASILSIGCNLIELKSDCYKIIWVTQRPTPMRSSNMGVWKAILKAQAFLAVLTNVLLFGFTSEQMQAWLPFLFEGAAEGESALGSGRFVVAICFAIEHIIYLFAFIIIALIPSIPEWVDNEVKRMAYENDQAARKLRRIASPRSLLVGEQSTPSNAENNSGLRERKKSS